MSENRKAMLNDLKGTLMTLSFTTHYSKIKMPYILFLSLFFGGKGGWFICSLKRGIY
jgi:NADH:ubiquinone oxidoreductase subunit H